MSISSDVVNDRIRALERQLVADIQSEVAFLLEHIKQCWLRMDTIEAALMAQDSKLAAFVARTPATVATTVTDIVSSDCFSSALNAKVEHEIANLIDVGGKCPGQEDCQNRDETGSGHETPKPTAVTTCQDEVLGGQLTVCMDPHEGGQLTVCMDPHEAAVELGSSCVAGPQICDSDPQGSEEDETIEVRLGASVWDATIMIGHPYVGRAGSVVLVALLILNFAMQLLFLYVVRNFLTSIALPEAEVQGFRYFRSSIGHSIDVLDLQTERTLAARVCDNDPALHWGIRQADAVGMVEDYMTRDVGPIMCLAASLVWILTVLDELRNSCLLSWAILRIPVHNSVESNSRVQAVFRALSGTKRLMIGIVMSIRIAIVAVLLCYGLKYLSYTVSLPDLLYNAAALELVLNVDELIYAALAPVHVRNALAEVEPVQIHAIEVNGIDVEMIVSAFVAIGALLSSIFLWLQPQIKQLTLAHQELCHGNKDFVIGYTPDGWLSWAEANVADIHQIDTTSKHLVIRQLIETERSGYEDTYASGLNVTLFRFRSLAAQSRSASIAEQTTWPLDKISQIYNSECHDIGDPRHLYSARWLGSVRDTLGMQSISHCREVSEYCGRNSLVAIRVRQACPQTCGCHTPASNLVATGADAGCSPSCSLQASYFAGLSLAPCVDTPVASLRVLVQSYRTYFADFIGQVADEVLWALAWALGELDKDGCGAVPTITSMFGFSWNLCTADQWPIYGVRNLNFHCPLTCKCEAGDRDCPESCASTFSNESGLR